MTLKILIESLQIYGNWEARFIHKNLEKNQLPKQWYYPPNNYFEGAQVLNIGTALEMAITEKHKTDDWFNFYEYEYLAFINVSSYSGESKLGYKAIKKNDINEMFVVNLKDLQNELFVISSNYFNDDINSFDKFYNYFSDLLNIDDFIKEIYNNIGKKVIPEFVDTV